MSEQRLAGRKVLVTGVGRAIGPAIVRRFAQAGARVAAANRTLSRAQTVVEDVTQQGLSAWALPLDLETPTGATEAVTTAVDQLGGLDIFGAQRRRLSLVPSGNTFRRRPGTDFVNQS